MSAKGSTNSQKRNVKADPDDILIEEFKQLWIDATKDVDNDTAVFNEYMEHVRTPKSKLELFVKIHSQQHGRARWTWGKCLCFLILPISIALGVAAFVAGPGLADGYDMLLDQVFGSECLVENNLLVHEISRPVFDCSACENLDEAPVEYDITKEDFVGKYAYSGVPVLIKGATKDWKALDSFSFRYLQNLYRNFSDAFEVTEEACQFFPYNTDLSTLEEAFNMSDARASYLEGEKPWYFGWSNCHSEIQKELRKQYQRPNFLPDDSESSTIDWLFMGGPGPGANIHMDNVQRPSWQAQISGSKTWFLIPPPECEHICGSHTRSMTMNKGDIVIVDTNQWYHSTFVHPGELSITIGSEYD